MRRIAFRPYLVVIWALAVVVASAAAVEPIALVVVTLATTPLLLVLCLLLPAARERRHRLLDTPLAILLGVAIIVSVVFINWPLRVSYILVRQGLESLAREVEAGRKIDVPVQVGLSRVKGTGIHDRGDVVCLWTDLNPDGRSGFVRTSAARVDSQFNLWSSVNLDKDWQFISED